MTIIDSQRTLAELVLERPGRARVFEQLQMDYCCGGDRSLAAAAERAGLDPQTVVAVLDAQEQVLGDEQAERDWREEPLGELCDHIVDVHHALLRRELPHIDGLVAKVASRHGETVPSLNDLQATFGGLQVALIAHIDREEAHLFPFCRGLDEAVDEQAMAVVRGELDAHEDAHAGVGQTLAEMRALAGDYRPEQALCTTYGVMLESLQALERDLHQHIHEENNVLFPRLRTRIDEVSAAA